MQFSLGGINKKVEKDYDVIIVGAGPAGLSAALYASRAKLKTLVLDKNALPGGTIALTSSIEDYPGIKYASGEELGKLLMEHAKMFGAEIMFNEEVREIKKEGNIFIVKTALHTFKAKAVIIATGSSYKKLNVPGEDKFYGKGVSNCAVCDAPFFKNKKVVVVGGGNSALDEALYLTKFAKEVIILNRSDKLKADKILQDKAFENPKIKILFNTQVKAIEGNEHIKGVRIYDKNGNESFLETDGVFVFIGLIPNSALVKGLVELDERGHIKTNENMETFLKGLFAAGDVRATPLQQAIVAAGEGAVAGYYASKYVESLA